MILLICLKSLEISPLTDYKKNKTVGF